MTELLTCDDIPKLKSASNLYTATYDLGYLLGTIQRFIDEDFLQLDPDFQRGHVWSRKQQVKWIEYTLRGGNTETPIYFNHPTWRDGGRSLDFVIVDGKQRLTAFMLFLSNELRVFKGLNGNTKGYLCKDLERVVIRDVHVKIAINNLYNYSEVLDWYLELNEGHVAHTGKELQRVRALKKQYEDSCN